MGQVRRDIEMRGENWEENRKWENRDGWRSVEKPKNDEETM